MSETTPYTSFGENGNERCNIRRKHAIIIALFGLGIFAVYIGVTIYTKEVTSDRQRTLQKIEDEIRKENSYEIQKINEIDTGLLIAESSILGTKIDSGDHSKKLSYLRKKQSVQGKQLFDLVKRVDRYHPEKITNPLHKFQISTSRRRRRSLVTIRSTTSATTSVHWVYYPPGTHDHRVKKVYAKLNVTFIGFGMPDMEIYSSKNPVSFKNCLTYCSEKRSKSRHYTDVGYNWSLAWCYCILNGSGHKQNNSTMHYRFH